MENNRSGATKKRQALLFMPLLFIPFLTMAFWALGGGKQKIKETESNGLNLQLPDAHLKEEKDANKLSFYQAAEKDSASRKERIKYDPYYKMPFVQDTSKVEEAKGEGFSYDPYPSANREYRDPNEEKVYRKLSELNLTLNQAAPKSSGNTSNRQSPFPGNNNPSMAKEDVARLERMVQNINTSGETDPEMDQLNSMMDKIIDIQHPERVKERTRTKSSGSEIYSLDPQPAFSSFSLLDTVKQRGKHQSSNSFFSLEEEPLSENGNAVGAVVHQNQSLVNGAVIRLRLTSDISIKGERIPAGTFVFGTTSLNGERLEVEISSIRYQSSLFPVELQVYDLDGIPGIYVPGAITRDVAKESAGSSLGMLEMNSLDPSLKAQAAAAGIGAAKSLLHKKAKLVRVSVKAGYRVLLKDGSSE